MKARFLSLYLALSLTGAFAQEPVAPAAKGLPSEAAPSPVPAAQLEPMLRDFQKELVRLRTALAEKPDDLALLSARGDAHLFLGQFAEAVADYERMIALDAAQDDRHWRLGIAYHFVGAWEKSARQFAKYHRHDAKDRENGIWKFLADVQTRSLSQARKEMLPYTRFDREPFPALYDLLAGKLEEGQFWSGLEQRGLTDERTVMFFAHYYAGLNNWVHGRRPEALQNIHTAVNLFTPEAAGVDGPGYMWQVARLHFAVLQHDPNAQP